MENVRQSVLSRMLGRARSANSDSSFDTVLHEQQVRIVYQPIVDLRTHAVFAYEGLARSLSPRFDGPVPLFEAAVQAKRVGELGRLLRAMAVDGCTEYPLFLNVNPNEFDEGWLVQPNDPLFWHDHPVYMEITESVPLSHFALCTHVIGEIRTKGVRLAIDDLGAGFSNLKYISELEPEIVKIDRELIAGVTMSSRKYRLLDSIVHLCKEMGAEVVAEGIETCEELDAVCATGARYGQGFLLAYPDTPPPKSVWPSGVA